MSTRHDGVAAALPHMKAQKSGHIINHSSVLGHRIIPTCAVYSATKFAVRVLSDGLREKVAADNIRVTVISPGSVRTELHDHIRKGRSAGEPGVEARSFTLIEARPLQDSAVLLRYSVDKR